MDIESYNRMSKRIVVPWEALKSTLLLRERRYQCAAGLESKNITQAHYVVRSYGNDTIKEKGCYSPSSMMHNNLFSFSIDLYSL